MVTLVTTTKLPKWISVLTLHRNVCYFRQVDRKHLVKRLTQLILVCFFFQSRMNFNPSNPRGTSFPLASNDIVLILTVEQGFLTQQPKIAAKHFYPVTYKQRQPLRKPEQRQYAQVEYMFSWCTLYIMSLEKKGIHSKQRMWVKVLRASLCVAEKGESAIDDREKYTVLFTRELDSALWASVKIWGAVFMQQVRYLRRYPNAHAYDPFECYGRKESSSSHSLSLTGNSIHHEFRSHSFHSHTSTYVEFYM